MSLKNRLRGFLHYSLARPAKRFAYGDEAIAHAALDKMPREFERCFAVPCEGEKFGVRLQMRRDPCSRRPNLLADAPYESVADGDPEDAAVGIVRPYARQPGGDHVRITMRLDAGIAAADALRLPAGFIDETRVVMKKLRNFCDEMDNLLFGNEIFQSRTRGIGVIPRDVAMQ